MFAHQAILLERLNGTWYPIGNTTKAHTICILKGKNFQNEIDLWKNAALKLGKGLRHEWVNLSPLINFMFCMKKPIKKFYKIKSVAIWLYEIIFKI